MSTDLFKAAAELTKPAGVRADEIIRREAQKAVTPGLHWWEDTDYPHGWKVLFGYSVEWDEGRANVWVHQVELDDGKHCVPIHLPQKDINAIESVIAGEVEAEAEADALALARDDGDYGDWCLEAQRDRLAMLEPDERVYDAMKEKL